MLYKVNDKLYIRPEAVAHIKFHEGLEAYIGTMSGLNLSITVDEGEALIAHINGAYNDVDESPAGKWRHITSVEKFISRSGNESWKAESDDVVVYFRQVQKEMLVAAGLWDDLNDMYIGETRKADIGLYTLPDGDLHKIISIDPGGKLFLGDEDDIPLPAATNIDPLVLDEDEDDEHFCCPDCGRAGWFDVGDSGEPDYYEVNICPDCGKRFTDDEARPCYEDDDVDPSA